MESLGHLSLTEQEKHHHHHHLKVAAETTKTRDEETSHPPHSRHTSSKYDFVKVRVWLGENADHYYVLSRFLLSRMLTVTKIPNHVAIKISLELKKLLIDNSLLDVSQTDLEANLFKLMERRGYGEEYINRYKMMTRFHHQRVPLVILVCGTACVGKSTVATQLAQRLNLPNVLQTDMVYELIRTSTDAPLPSTPVWERDFSSQEELVTEFARECRILRKGLHGDLKKAMKDGKPIIIEGIHLDPSIYLMDEESNGKTSHADSPTAREGQKGISSTKQGHNINAEDATNIESTRISEENIMAEIVGGSRGIASSIDSCHEPHYAPTINSSSLVKGQLPNFTNAVNDQLPEKTTKKASTKAIIIPIVLKMDEFDHKTLLEEWVVCRSNKGAFIDEAEKEAIISRLMTIQDYLCSFKSQGIIVKNISATTFPQTLDSLHSYLLQRIEEGCQFTANSPDKNEE